MSRSPFPKMLPCTVLLSALFWGALIPRDASADLVYTTTPANTSDGDGPISAKVSFTPLNGGIEIILTNTATGTFAKGQAISDLSFTVAGGLSAPTFFTELIGRMFNPSSNTAWTATSGTAFDDKSPTTTTPPPNAIDHWGFQPTGSSVLLATANSPVPGAGNPHYMVLPSSGTAGPGSSLANSNFFPFVNGPLEFLLTVPGVTTSTTLTTANFTNVQISFGTGPDATLNTTGSGSSGGGGGPGMVPEPSTLTVALGCCALGFLAVRARRRFSNVI